MSVSRHDDPRTPAAEPAATRAVVRAGVSGAGVTALVAGVLLVAPAALGAPTPDSGPTAGGTEVTVPVPGPDSFLVTAAGFSHSLAIDAGGDIWAWGTNGDGQLGNGELTWDLTTPTQITEVTGFTAVAAGNAFSLAIDAGGNLWSWGDDAHGVLGNGAPTDDVGTPVRFTLGTTFTGIAAGSHHALALDEDGNVWAWGSDAAGQVGNGATTGDVAEPAQITSGTSFVAIAAGGSHSLAIDTAGTVWAWGSDASGQVGNGAPTGVVASPAPVTSGTVFTSVAAGQAHSLALDAAGTVWAWGGDTYGQAGHGGSTGDVSAPTPITTGTVFTSVTAGDLHSVALDASGNLWSWGNDGNAQLGNGAPTADVVSPAQITTGTVFASATSGLFHGVAIDNSGALWAWGSDAFHQTGNGNTTGLVTSPVQVSFTTSFTAVAAGQDHSLAIDANGALWSWGEGGGGRLGTGSTADVTTARRAVPDTSLAPSQVYTAVSGGTYASYALDAAGNVWAWGEDDTGQLGDGAATGGSTIPIAITSGVVFTAISAGSGHGVALDAGGNVWTWGSDSTGELGNGPGSDDVVAPQQVTAGTVFTAISTRYNHVLALDAAGNVWAWGWQGLGAVGIDSGGADVEAPTQVTSGVVFTGIAAGAISSAAIDTDGELWTWGTDLYGQLANGAGGGTALTPQRVTTGADFDTVAMGDYHGLAIDTSGDVWAWGRNSAGQAGNGAPTGLVELPERITTNGGFTSVSGGMSHSLAVNDAGEMLAWGTDLYGQLGNGRAGGIVPAPTRIGGPTSIEEILFAGVAGTGLTRVSDTVARVTTPPGTAGAAAVTVRYRSDTVLQPDLTVRGAFTYLAPPSPTTSAPAPTTSAPAPTTSAPKPSPARPSSSAPSGPRAEVTASPTPDAASPSPVLADEGDATASPSPSVGPSPEPSATPGGEDGQGSAQGADAPGAGAVHWAWWLAIFAALVAVGVAWWRLRRVR